MDRDGEWETPGVTVTQVVVARMQRVLALSRGATARAVHIVPMPEWSGALDSLLPPLYLSSLKWQLLVTVWSGGTKIVAKRTSRASGHSLAVPMATAIHICSLTWVLEG